MNPFKTLYARLGRPKLCNPFKRNVTIVYESDWLYGTYAFTFRAGASGIMDAWQDHFVSNLPDSMTSADIAAARTNPRIAIVEVF